MKGKILRTGLVFLPLTVAVILLDYFSKTWIINNVPAYEPEGYIEVIRNFFSIVHVHNHGAAFSFLADREGWQKVLFGAVAVLVSCYLLFLMYRNKASDLLPNISFALIIGGALGNLYDRVIAIEPEFPAPPTTDGSYNLTVTVSDGAPVYTWEATT